MNDIELLEALRKETTRMVNEIDLITHEREGEKVHRQQIEADRDIAFRDRDMAHKQLAAKDAEIAELREDAERYRFARSRAHVATPRLKSCLWILRGVFEVKYNPSEIHGFDAAIDAARSGE